MKLFSIILLILICIVINTQSSAQESYLVPPSSYTRGSVPVISDEEMEECVKLYTFIERNQYIRDTNALVDRYNRNCAGKQSYSACEKANELNRKNGLPEQPCR